MVKRLPVFSITHVVSLIAAINDPSTYLSLGRGNRRIVNSTDLIDLLNGENIGRFTVRNSKVKIACVMLSDTTLQTSIDLTPLLKQYNIL